MTYVTPREGPMLGTLAREVELLLAAHALADAATETFGLVVVDDDAIASGALGPVQGCIRVPDESVGLEPEFVG